MLLIGGSPKKSSTEAAVLGSPKKRSTEEAVLGSPRKRSTEEAVLLYCADNQICMISGGPNILLGEVFLRQTIQFMNEGSKQKFICAQLRCTAIKNCQLTKISKWLKTVAKIALSFD